MGGQAAEKEAAWYEQGGGSEAAGGLDAGEGVAEKEGGVVVTYTGPYTKTVQTQSAVVPTIYDEIKRIEGLVAQTESKQVDEEAGVTGEEHHQQMVMTNPDGSMVMLLSPNNPYHKAQLEHDGAAAPPQEGTETPPVIHPAILEQFHGPLQLERMARVVRLLAL